MELPTLQGTNRNESESETTGSENDMTPAPPLRGVELLVVEDAPGDRGIARWLTERGAGVTLECNGPAAGDTIRRRLSSGRCFDAVILNLWSSTVEAAAIIRLAGHRGVVIAVAVVVAAVEDRWRRAGCDLVMPMLDAPLSIATALERTRSRRRTPGSP